MVVYAVLGLAALAELYAIKYNSATAGSPAPNDGNNGDDDTDDGDQYESNPKHNQNAKEMFENHAMLFQHCGSAA